MRQIQTALFALLSIAAFAISKPQTAFLSNEKVFLFQFSDSSSFNKLEGWPQDTQSQLMLTRHLFDCYKNLFAEFKRCEKFGFYEMVEDSMAATVRIRCTVRPYVLSKDTLNFPVRIDVRKKTGLDPFTTSIQAAALYRTQSKPKSPLHKIDYLLADFRRHFPYAETVRLFYPTK